MKILKNIREVFNWILLAAHCFIANIYHMKFLDGQIFPQVYYIGLFFSLYMWHLLIFSGYFQQWMLIKYDLYFFFICTLNFLQVDIREKKSYEMKVKEKTKCQNVLYWLLKQLFFHDNKRLIISVDLKLKMPLCLCLCVCKQESGISFSPFKSELIH